MLYRRTAPTVPNPSTYEPSLLVIAQGRIRVDLGKASYVFGQSRFLVTSLEVPVMSQVITASEKAPYLAFFLKLDMSTVRDILNTEEVHIPEASSGACAMATGETTVELVNSCSRVNGMRKVRGSRWVARARANSIASTGDSLASPQCAISRPCKPAKSWR